MTCADTNNWYKIASVKFMRSEGYQSYFKYLDEAGGFFYERLVLRTHSFFFFIWLSSIYTDGVMHLFIL